MMPAALVTPESLAMAPAFLLGQLRGGLRRKDAIAL